MMNRGFWCATVFALLLCAGDWLAAEYTQRTAADILGGDAVVQVLRDAKVVKVYRLKDQSIQHKVEDYVATAGPFDVEPKVAANLAQALTRFESFERGVAVGCEPQFGMRTSFTAGKTQIDVVYCFSCDTLVVYRNGEKLGDGYFAPAHKELVAIAKKMLPQDKVIQSLK